MISWRGALTITTGMFLLPVIFSALYKHVDIGPIGPLVIGYSLLGLPVFVLIYSFVLRQKYKPVISTTIGLVSGILMAVLLLNCFMLVTSLFGVNGYQPM